ncbi:MAG: glucose 1-dehydrogenase [Verrucomicrobia bacterium]|nr:glucose 1-dehydrogenase [Verrucomicrobiota bacterium]
MPTSSDNAFADKVVLVTGGTAGIGRATAVAFARHGAKVVVSGRRKNEGLESVALVEKAGSEGLFVRADVSQEEDVAALIASTVERFGRLDIAFNNAGVIERGPVIDITVESYEHIFGINVRGVALGLKHEITAMLKTGGGSIVNNASVLGIRPYPELSLYNASKFAVIGLTKTAALEYATKGIRVNAVCPAIIETDMTAMARDDEHTRNNLLLTHPVRRFGTPEEVADAVLWLSSPVSGFVTGINLPVDGGFTV